ncbi:uncharacterized protein LOC62_02G003262 [Vanrija pseudolonga]|uniref:DUF1275 domain protein n=1 Tax=Vanrija pseudolonga TaxID=143232 RepID=A0AAF0Y885_9TREE|nr:hypothetical protein LOC62_02G003262 [Vanrija pseudolonga]
MAHRHTYTYGAVDVDDSLLPSPPPEAETDALLAPSEHAHAPHSGDIEADAWAAGKRAAHVRAAWADWLNEDLGPPDMVYSNLVITLSTSMLDAVMFTLFGTFTTNQTGNTVFLTLAALHRGSKKLILTATALGGFFGAGLLFGQLGAYFGHRRRVWVLTTMTYQVVVLAAFCFLVSPLAPEAYTPEGVHAWVPMLLSAIQGGPQVVMATNLGVPEMPTAMVTSAYAGLISDTFLFSHTAQVPRDRRIVYLTIFWIGAFLGLGAEQFISAWFASSLACLFKAIALIMIWRSRSAEETRGRHW